MLLRTQIVKARDGAGVDGVGVDGVTVWCSSGLVSKHCTARLLMLMAIY